MSDSKKNSQQVVEMAKFLNVHLTTEQIVAVEKMLAIGVAPVNLVRFLQYLNPPLPPSSSS